MQLSLKRSWYSTLWQIILSAIWRSKPLDLIKSRQYDIYRTCQKLPMDKFLDCLCDDNLYSLGDAPLKVLYETWVLILFEFYELKGERIDGTELMRRDILRLQDHLYLLDLCVEILKERYSESIAQSVRKLGYSFSPIDKTPEGYKHLLHIIVNQSKTKYIQIQQLVKQLSDAMASIIEVKPKRENYEGMLIAFEEMQKVSYSMELVTVSKFIQLEKKYWRMIELMQVKK